MTGSRILALTLLATMGVSAQEESTATVVFRAVLDSQRAGHERHDVEGYLATLTPDAKFICARSEHDSPHDQTFTREQIGDRAKLIFSSPPGRVVKLREPRVVVDGDHATVHVKASHAVKGRDPDTYQERYLLRRTSAGWKIYENRYWPLVVDGVEYTADRWQLADARVARAQASDDSERRVTAFRWAWRFTEAHSAAKAWTTTQPRDANAWLARAWCALHAVDGKDSYESFCRALLLDPALKVPSWVKVVQERRAGAKKPKPKPSTTE